MARDYYGHAVERSEGPLARALEIGLPVRFDRQQRPAIDYPWNYAGALLEAAVAAATLAGEPYDISSPSVLATIDELVEKVRAVPRSAVLQLVADIDVEQPFGEDRLGETLEVAGARVIRVGNEPERFIEREFPSAGYEVERSQVFVHPGPASLVVANAGMMADYETRVSEARRRVSLFIAAVRMATGSTAYSMIDIEGDPDRVHAIHPSITPLPSWGLRFVYRPVTLTASQLPGLTNLALFIDSWGGDAKWVAINLALSRLSRSLDGRTPGIADQVVDLAIGLEAALAGTDRPEIGLRLRSRAADILATDADPPEAIYRDVKTLYDLRSTIVHGGSLTEPAAKRAITGVTGASASKVPGEQYELALDRWRDVLRRAILSRMALTTAPFPWTSGAKSSKNLDVDEFLLAESHRSAWREHIHEYWTNQGLPNAPDPPPAARLRFGAASTAPIGATE